MKNVLVQNMLLEGMTASGVPAVPRRFLSVYYSKLTTRYMLLMTGITRVGVIMT